MIKTTLTLKNNKLNLTVPKTYVGKELEILVYSKDELIEEKDPSKKKLADFTRILDEKSYNDLKAHIEKAREEWNRNI